jgi:hypothetical protein
VIVQMREAEAFYARLGFIRSESAMLALFVRQHCDCLYFNQQLLAA